MHRFYLPPAECSEGMLILAGREAHHAVDVMRLQRGDRMAITDGTGHEYLCEVREWAHRSLRLAVLQKTYVPPSPWPITLLQGIPKGKVFEAIIQKATELGVARIVPLLSERVVAHLDDEKSELKVAKWKGVAIEAIKQCGSAWLPQIEAPMSIRSYLARGERHELAFIAALQGDRQHPRAWFKQFWSEHQRLPRSVCVWVGPEGDCTSAEADAVRSAGALGITLGRWVLRSDTAAIYCLSVLNYELQSDHP